MLTYGQAVELVREDVAPRWDAHGSLYVAPNGFESDSEFLVPVGAREWLVGNDAAFALISDTAVFVNKQTGLIITRSVHEHLDLIDSMRAVDVSQIDVDAPVPE